MPIFKGGANVVRVDVQVQDGAGLLTGLEQKDFIVFDENTQQITTHFDRQREAMSLVLLLDVSGSMAKFIDAMARSSRQAMANLKNGDKVAVMLFSRSQKVKQELTDDFDSVARQINSAVNDKSVGSGTLINHAVVAAADYLATTAPIGRRSILIVTDNLGLNYQLNNEQVLRKLHGSSSVLNAIVVGRGKRPDAVPSRYTNTDFTPSNVFHLAEETGGEAFTPEKVESALASIFERIRSRYALEYSAPVPAKPGEFHKIRVFLSPEAERRYPKAKLRTRAGYYAAE